MNTRQALTALGDTNVAELAVIVAAVIMTIIGIAMVWPQLF